MADFGQSMSSQFIFVNKGNFTNISAVELEFGIYSSLLYKPSGLQQTNKQTDTLSKWCLWYYLPFYNFIHSLMIVHVCVCVCVCVAYRYISFV
jgi:hypothetical protein